MCTAGLSASSQMSLSATILNQLAQNLQNNPSLRWQYFGTEDGNVFYYPAAPQLCKSSSWDPRLRPVLHQLKVFICFSAHE
jgi:hypothetical protein